MSGVLFVMKGYVMLTVKDKKIESLLWTINSLQRENDTLKQMLNTNTDAKEMIAEYEKEYRKVMNKLKETRDRYLKLYEDLALAKKDYEKQMHGMGFKKRKLRRLFWKIFRR